MTVRPILKLRLTHILDSSGGNFGDDYKADSKVDADSGGKN